MIMMQGCRLINIYPASFSTLPYIGTILSSINRNSRRNLIPRNSSYSGNMNNGGRERGWDLASKIPLNLR